MGISNDIVRVGMRTIGLDAGARTVAETFSHEVLPGEVLGKDALILAKRQGATLKASDLQALDQAIEETLIRPSDAGKLDLRAALDAKAAPVYGDEGLWARARKAISGWVNGGRQKRALRDAYTQVVVQGKAPAADLEQTLVDVLATRPARWQRLAAAEKLPMPEAFRLYRGVDGEYAVKAVLDAWLDKEATMEVPLYDLTSWSLKREVADKFAMDEAANVVYQADVPFAQTVADKWVDGGAFVSLCHDQDEVVVGKALGGIRIPEKDATVRYRGKTFAYGDREALAEAWAKDHP